MIKALDKKGVTAMETLIGIGLVSVIVMTVYSSLIGAMNNTTESRKRIGAIALANEKMEFIRNLEYNEIGTIQGIVPGPLYSSENVSKNNYAYNIKTEVRYIDDPTDGEFPSDPVNNDYKQVHIEVDWGIPEKSVSLYSVFVPNGLETNINSGTLSINVIDSTGVPVPAVSIEIQSLDDNPIIDYTTGTDDSGNLVLPGVPSQYYRIFLSKDGYENVRTYPNPPESEFTPFDADLFIAEANLTTKTFFMDKSADLTLKAINIATNEGIENINFDIKGGKKIGSEPDTFNLKETKSTDSFGEANFSNISAGEYLIENIDSLETDDYAYVGAEARLPIQLSAEEVRDFIFLFADKNRPSLVVSVKDSITEEPLRDASVTLTDGVFDQTILTGEEGLAFFPQIPDVLTAGDYELSVSLDGYSDHNGNVEINDLVKENITLNLE